MTKIQNTLFNKHEDLVHLHEYAQQRSELKAILGQMNHKKITVSPATLSVLKEAQDLNISVKKRIPLGAGNQIVNIWETQGKSMAAATYVKASSDTRTHANRVIAYGAEQCDGFAATSYEFSKSKITDRPIFLIGDMSIGHIRLLFGDPRDPRWGEHNTVSQDAWHPLASACVLSQAQFNTPHYGKVLNVYYSSIDAQHGTPVDFNPPRSCHSLPPDTAINKKLRSMELPPLGPEFLKFAMEADSTSFHTTTGTNDCSTIYSDEQGNEGQFDVLPKSLVDSYIKAHNEISAHKEYGQSYLNSISEWDHTAPDTFDSKSKSLSWPTAIREALHPLTLENWNWRSNDMDKLEEALQEEATSIPPNKLFVFFKALLKDLNNITEHDNEEPLYEKQKAIDIIKTHCKLLSDNQRIAIMQTIPETINHLSHFPPKQAASLIIPLIELIEADLLPSDKRDDLHHSMIDALGTLNLTEQDQFALRKYIDDILDID